MSNASDYLANKLLDHITGKAAYTAPTAYVAVSTANPGDDGTTIAEPGGGSYARVATAAADWNAAATRSITNAEPIEFPTATGDWGTITHFAVFDAASGGNMLFYGALGESRNTTSGKTLRFPAGDLSASIPAS